MSTIAVRLEGGLGDHLLGMRVLRFIRARYPRHAIVAYSDSAGHPTQQQIAALSPFVSEVVPVFRRPVKVRADGMGKLDEIRDEDLDRMRSADHFIDTYGAIMLTAASRSLDIPLFELLAHRPELVIPAPAHEAAARWLAPFGDSVFVGMNLVKYGAERLRGFIPRVMELLCPLLRDSRVVVLNMYTTKYEFTHWPEPERTMRETRAIEEGQVLTELCARHERIVPCVDQPIETVVALLARCRYFIGIDNGIKHLAWALGVPHTFLHPKEPEMLQILRWMPDFHRILQFDCSSDDLTAHVVAARQACDNGRV
jgi:hypothetical protein